MVGRVCGGVGIVGVEGAGRRRGDVVVGVMWWCAVGVIVVVVVKGVGVLGRACCD